MPLNKQITPTDAQAQTIIGSWLYAVEELLKLAEEHANIYDVEIDGQDTDARLSKLRSEVWHLRHDLARAKTQTQRHQGETKP